MFSHYRGVLMNLGRGLTKMTKVRVEQGWLEGELVESITKEGKYHSFKGIPYAAPPVGELRFKAPQAPLAWDGVKKAIEHGSVCPQKDMFSGKLIEGSEDCLYLNVYTPNVSPENPLPVMFFIHGGGYKSGSGNDEEYGPDFLVDHDVIVVTINYRLEVLGFLCLDTAEVPGNAGMKDQVYALKWVKQNICNFGGDPNNITVFGESAGGASTSLHMISPMSKGLFKRSIAMSGVPFCDWSTPFRPQKRAFVLGKQLGLDTKDPQELLKFFQSLPVEKLIAPDPCVLTSDQNFNHFTPVVEKDFEQDAFLFHEPGQILKEGKVNDVETMFGYTSDEFLIALASFGPSISSNHTQFDELFLPTKLLRKIAPTKISAIAEKIRNHYFGDKLLSDKTLKEFIKCSSDAIFVYDIRKFLSMMHKYNNRKCFLYKFSAFYSRNVFGNQIKHGITGTSHLDDLMYLFDPKGKNLPLNKEDKSYETIKNICTLFTNFAKYGNPTPDSSLGAIWLEYDDVYKSYLNIGADLTPGNAVDQEVIEFWDKIYEMAGMPYEELILNN